MSFLNIFRRKRNTEGTTATTTATATLEPPAPKATAGSAAPTPPSAPSTLTPNLVITHEMIATLAYFKWEQKGRPAGTDLQDWREAEAELRARAKANR